MKLEQTRSALDRYDWGALERWMNWAESWANPADICLRVFARQEDLAALLDVQVAYQQDTGSDRVLELWEIRAVMAMYDREVVLTPPSADRVNAAVAA